MGKLLLWPSLALTPAALIAGHMFHANETLVFTVAALALGPLAFLIGEATEQIAEHVGPGVGGFLNASFGNAPELIIALFAVSSGLPDVVRGSITGSVVSTSLLVLGAAMIFSRDDSEIDRRSIFLQSAMVVGAGLLFLIPSISGWHGDPERHSLYMLTLPIAGLLLAVYIALTVKNLRVHRSEHTADPADDAWSLRNGVVILTVATVATAFVSEQLVHTIGAFGESLGLSEFFVAVVIVALVGNATEHGGAIVVARRGNPKLGAEIAVSSAAQVAVFVAPAIALGSGLMGKGLTLNFRPIEVATMIGSGLVVALVALDGRTRRWEGALLTLLYLGAVAGFWFTGDR